MDNLLDVFPNFGVQLPAVTFTNLASWIASGFMIFGGIVPYIPQYMDIRRTENADGFSTYVCLTLLVANILRILFWFGHPFELPLLAQSVVMLFTMMTMLHLCTKVNRLQELSIRKRRFVDRHHLQHHSSDTSGHVPPLPQGKQIAHRKTLFDFETKNFWNWTYFVDYVIFITVFSILGGVITYFLAGQSIFVETLGFLAVFVEAMLGMPQFYRNFQNKSTVGMSVKMVCCWLSGDVFKTIYFVLKEAPPQFWVCGIIQVTMDVAILIQVCYYKDKPPQKVIKIAATENVHIS
ncbi:PQ-loop repeat-containing protein 1-like isoform X1 [Acanthaster planci]|uniref:Solute carrier family 66 member 2 n=1 Tax=Acanthaster planci TaxID=133434 RepID=A0A8B7Z3X6_ACAPL|nr:PQ-loop repeat-containing protein 1-like isoform X1 [Acanthaster planci]